MLLPVGDDIHKPRFPVVPVALIVLNIAVYVLQSHLWNVSFDANDHQYEAPEAYVEFIQTWGLVPCELVRGQVVGLLTYMFLHGDLIHLIGNMFFLWTFSYSLEVGMGRWSLLGIYLVFGVVAGLCDALLDLSRDVPLLGASGAVAGLMGAYMVLYGLGSKIHTILFVFIPIRISCPAWLFGLGWFGTQFYFAGQDPEGAGGVAWYAHIGGFMAGVIVTEVCRNDTQAGLVRARRGLLRFEQRNTSVAAAQETGVLAGGPELDPDHPFVSRTR